MMTASNLRYVFAASGLPPQGTAYAVYYPQNTVDMNPPGIPVKAYYSYQAFQADGPQPVDWVMYDTEHGGAGNTPPKEQNDPIAYMNEFGKLAHRRGYKVINAPARDLYQATAPVCPTTGLTTDEWYLQACGLGLPGGAAGNSDIWLCQSEKDETSVTAYRALVGGCRSAITASSNPGCLLYAELSTDSGTVRDMVESGDGVIDANVAGFYLAIPDGDIHAAIQVIQGVNP